MPKIWQRLLLIAGLLAFVALAVEIAMSILATVHGDTPARVVAVDAGPYPLTIKFYKDPANAGFALPFMITPQKRIEGTLQYQITSEAVNIPSRGSSSAKPIINASISSDPGVVNGIQGNAEIPVQGQWKLHVIVRGPSGTGVADVPITAVAPPPLPLWIGWPLGFIPLAGLALFLILQRGQRQRPSLPQQQ